MSITTPMPMTRLLSGLVFVMVLPRCGATWWRVEYFSDSGCTSSWQGKEFAPNPVEGTSISDCIPVAFNGHTVYLAPGCSSSDGFIVKQTSDSACTQPVTYSYTVDLGHGQRYSLRPGDYVEADQCWERSNTAHGRVFSRVDRSGDLTCVNGNLVINPAGLTTTTTTVLAPGSWRVSTFADEKCTQLWQEYSPSVLLGQSASDCVARTDNTNTPYTEYFQPGCKGNDLVAYRYSDAQCTQHRGFGSFKFNYPLGCDHNGPRSWSFEAATNLQCSNGQLVVLTTTTTTPTTTTTTTTTSTIPANWTLIVYDDTQCSGPVANQKHWQANPLMGSTGDCVMAKFLMKKVYVKETGCAGDGTGTPNFLTFSDNACTIPLISAYVPSPQGVCTNHFGGMQAWCTTTTTTTTTAGSTSTTTATTTTTTASTTTAGASSSSAAPVTVGPPTAAPATTAGASSTTAGAPTPATAQGPATAPSTSAQTSASSSLFSSTSAAKTSSVASATSALPSGAQTTAATSTSLPAAVNPKDVSIHGWIAALPLTQVDKGALTNLPAGSQLIVDTTGTRGLNPGIDTASTTTGLSPGIAAASTTTTTSTTTSEMPWGLPWWAWFLICCGTLLACLVCLAPAAAAPAALMGGGKKKTKSTGDVETNTTYVVVDEPDALE